MGRYKKNINHIVDKVEVDDMIDKAKSIRDKALIAVLYLTGARTEEVKTLKAEHITEDTYSYKIKMRTVKLGRNSEHQFVLQDRILEFKKNTPFLTYILMHKENCKDYMFPISTTRMRQIVYKLSEDRFCPYNFRHSRMTKLAWQGAGPVDLMHWKGSLDTRSVNPYIRGKPVGKQWDVD